MVVEGVSASHSGAEMRDRNVLEALAACGSAEILVVGNLTADGRSTLEHRYGVRVHGAPVPRRSPAATIIRFLTSFDPIRLARLRSRASARSFEEIQHEFDAVLCRGVGTFTVIGRRCATKLVVDMG